MKRMIIALLMMVFVLTGCQHSETEVVQMEEIVGTVPTIEVHKIVPKPHTVDVDLLLGTHNVETLFENAFAPYSLYFTIETYTEQDDKDNLVCYLKNTDLVSYIYNDVNGWHCSVPVNSYGSDYPAVYWTQDRVIWDDEKEEIYYKLYEQGWDRYNIVISKMTDTGVWDFKDCETGEIISIDDIEVCCDEEETK